MAILRIISNALLLLLAGFIIFNSFPIFAFAKTDIDDLEVAGWIPYWNDSNGIKDAKKHINEIDVVYPFSYEVQSDGTLKDKAGMQDKEWRDFVKYAQKKKVKVVPSVIWFDGGLIHANLSYENLRKKHIEEITEMVEKGNYDGVNIDYESKFSSTIDHFSAFLTELKDELGDDKILSCTIEARTPPESLYKEVPKPLLYANDFKVIGEVCDTVEIMAYDQQRADLKLNASKSGTPYMPVADVDWVEKVVKLALVDIPEDKILIGAPTYGHHYEVTVAPNWFKDYRRIGALNMPDMLEVADDYNAKPSRNKAGEMSFSYIPKSSTVKFPSSLKIPSGTPTGEIVSAKALALANKTGQEVKFNLAWYSDYKAIEDKIELAQEYDLRGIAMFKFDGEEDQKVWSILD